MTLAGVFIALTAILFVINLTHFNSRIFDLSSSLNWGGKGKFKFAGLIEGRTYPLEVGLIKPLVSV
jgi:hypothetical protein